MSRRRVVPGAAGRHRRPHRAPPAAHGGDDATAVEITAIAAGGDGVGRAEGLVVFTPRTAPGDRARVRIAPARGGRFARGTLVAIEHPSASRVVAPCTHYTADRCGGCQLQHLTYEAQLDAKAGIVRDALSRIARRPVATVAIRRSPTEWRYRRKLTLALRATADGDWVSGLHRFDAPDEIFALHDCRITDAGVVNVWRSIMAVARLLPTAPSLRGAVRTTDDGYAFVVEGGDRWTGAHALADAVPALCEIWWVPTEGARRRVAHRAPLPGSATGASFVQVNDRVAAALHASVVARVLAHAPGTVIDAYAGTGATSVALAQGGIRVTAIEADAGAARACAAALPAGSRVIVDRVEHALAQALPADVVILNPPRQGVAPEVVAALETAAPRPRAVVYVSCDPATLARDVGRLSGWRVGSVEAFDMFPQTAHVETICELLPADGEA